MTAPGTMTLAELQKLVTESKGEWEHIEFKKSTGELHGGMETLCGFLNGTGGKVLFGVTNAGRIQGQDMADATFQEIANAIRKLEPPAWIEQIRIPVAGAKEVLILRTTVHAEGPYTFDGRPYTRIGNTTSRMPQPDYQRRLLARIATQHRWENHCVRRLCCSAANRCRTTRSAPRAWPASKGRTKPSFSTTASCTAMRFRFWMRPCISS
jgi:predicted HTH transcriptional regulator